MKRLGQHIRSFIAAHDGSVAPTVALSLVGLIAAGGLAFDYSRLVTLDTELQNAADQAALAAVTQLDREPDQCARAEVAARNLVANDTRFATDDGGRLVTIPEDKADTEGSESGVVCDEEAREVTVTVNVRRVDYALTPIVHVMSGSTSASATAALGSAICNSPPLMMCNPKERTEDGDLDLSDMRGRGLKLVSGGGWTPGNFGFLVTGAGNGAKELAMALGYDRRPGECLLYDGVTTEPGEMLNARAAFNTRFDVYDSTLNNIGCKTADGPCSPALNVRKDVVKNGQCFTNNGWREPTVTYSATSATVPETMGHPRDICHAINEDAKCSYDTDGRIGDGNWDRDKYFKANFNWDSATWKENLHDFAQARGEDVDATTVGGGTFPLSRYTVYLWEQTPSSEGGGLDLLDDPKPVAGGTAHSVPICNPPGLSGTGTVDRRRVSIAVVNCIAEEVKGRDDHITDLKWADVFLVEPSLRRPGRTREADIYTEIIGMTETAGDGDEGQVVRRDVPYLVR